jgi:NTE family protein
MSLRRIAIACQGGGSQCAFVAGSLKALFARQIQHRYKVVGLSGTSGGAFTAALAWAGLLKQAHGDPTPIEDGIIACWHDLTAQTPLEIAFDGVSVELLRLVERGLLPSFALSPSSLRFQLWARWFSTLVSRPEFTDLRALLVKHLDFEQLVPLVRSDSPALLVGAVDVLGGDFKVFTSLKGEVTVDALLASAAIPTLFPAVWVDGHAYWDGIFSSNPPIVAFLRKAFMGSDNPLPDEIWIIQVNPSTFKRVPELPAEITDRRNHLAGNLSLRHELQVVDMVNMLFDEHALTAHFRARFGFDVTEAIEVRFIRMSPGLQKELDYASKLSRQPNLIAKLIADGEAQANAFLDDLQETESSVERQVGEASREIH